MWPAPRRALNLKCRTPEFSELESLLNQWLESLGPACSLLQPRILFLPFVTRREPARDLSHIRTAFSDHIGKRESIRIAAADFRLECQFSLLN
jgi:hypothetical protein